jgi:hypothetical protein
VVDDAELGAFDPACQGSISDSFGIFLFWIRSKVRSQEDTSKV